MFATTLLRFFKRRSTVVFAAIIVVVVIVTIVGPLFVDSPSATVYSRLETPGGDHWLGTDALGRDYFARVIHGGRVSLLVGFSVAVLCMTLGTAIGALAGYYGGVIDTAVVKVAEFFQVLPGLVLALVAAALFGSSATLLILILALTMWPNTARIMRAKALKISGLGYVESAQAAGFRNTRILLTEVIPNAMPPVLVATTMTVGRAILLESGLAYLGIGDPNNPSWGALLNTAQSNMHDAWWLAVAPGAAIFIVVLAINMLGDNLNDLLNPLTGRVKGGQW